jgi:hypothetical protein
MPIIQDITIPAGNIKRIHVNQFIIKRYHKTGEDAPAWIIRTSRGVYYCKHWTVRGPMEGMQSLSKPMPGCNARLWIETRAEITLHQAERVEETCVAELEAA